MFTLFKKAKDITIDKVGLLRFRDGSWQGVLRIGDNDVELSLDGKKEEPNTFCIDYLTENIVKLNILWSEAIEFSRLKMTEKNFDKKVIDSSFQLVAVSIHRQGVFDGGELVFWFEIEADTNGGYYVSFKENAPINFHRD